MSGTGEAGRAAGESSQGQPRSIARVWVPELLMPGLKPGCTIVEEFDLARQFHVLIRVCRQQVPALGFNCKQKAELTFPALGKLRFVQ